MSHPVADSLNPVPQVWIAPWFPALAHWRRSGQKRWWYSGRQSSPSTSGGGWAMIAACPGWQGQWNQEPDLPFQRKTQRSAGCSLRPERSRTKVLPPHQAAHQTGVGQGRPTPKRCLGPSSLPITDPPATPSLQPFPLDQADTPPSVARSLLGLRMGGGTDTEAQRRSSQLNARFLSQLVSVQPLSPYTQAGRAACYQLWKSELQMNTALGHYLPVQRIWSLQTQ
jgi:hypothetical protein